MLKLIVLRPNQSISISLHRVYIFERGVVMSIQEKIQEHVKEKCKYCLKEDCDGIHINTNNEATCEREREE